MTQFVKKVQVFILLFLAITIFSIACFFASNPSASASPTATPYLLVSPLAYVSNELGETFKIDVNVFNVENLRAFEFQLSYNTTLLDVVQVDQGSFFPLSPESSVDKFETNETKGSVWFGMSLSNSTSPRNGNGTLASITLEVTFAPLLPEKACCVLDLHETLLYDNTMTAIVHQLNDGLYFWKSMLDDPDGGLLLDLTTQKGGTGLGVPSPPFLLGETVELRVLLTFNEAPQVNYLVSFQVLDPSNETIFTRVAFTDNNGVATIEFRISVSEESIGIWTAYAVSEVKGITVWDILYFKVRAPVGGLIAPIEKVGLSTSRVDPYPFILPLIVMLVMLVKGAASLFNMKREKREKEELAEYS